MQILIMSIILPMYDTQDTQLCNHFSMSNPLILIVQSDQKKEWNLFDIQAYYDNFSDISHISDFQLVLDGLQEIYLHVKKSK